MLEFATIQFAIFRYWQQTFKSTKKDKLKLSETKIKFRYSRSHAMLCDIDFCTCVSVSVYIFHPCSFLSSECCSCKYFFLFAFIGPSSVYRFLRRFVASFFHAIYTFVCSRLHNSFSSFFFFFFQNVLFCLAHFIRW